MDSTPITFPTIEARNLEGRNFTLPGDFEGDLNVAIVAFKRWHQSSVDSWMPWLNQKKADFPRLRVYELPTISGIYLLARPFIDGGMAVAIPNKEVRATTLTVYTDVQRVMRALDLPNMQTIALFLVDPSGRIFWRGKGGYDDQQAAALAGVLSQQFSKEPSL